MDLVFTETSASGMQDVAGIANVVGAAVTVCGFNGTVWRTTDGGRHFSPVTASGFRRVTASPDGSYLWGVGANGSLWSSVAVSQWTRFEATAKLGSLVEDAVVDYDNSLWITTQNGQMWAIRDGRNWEWHTVLAQFKRLAVGPGHRFWGISSDGALWRRDGSQPEQWYTTKGTGMEDVSITSSGQVWLVGSNGTVWITSDGEHFSRLLLDGPFLSVSAAGGDVVWLVRKNGSVCTL